uniref:KH domain-containing protein n=1 Tax=Steinernema glaseri TaxID=37863 RepID=A0A1I7ZHD2_9BILA
MNAHDVNIKVPGKGSESANPDEITVTGVPENVEAAIADILELVEGYNKDAEDKKLKMFRLDVVVDPKYHQRLIGPKGSEIRTLRERHNVQISFPPDSSKAPRPDDKRRDVRDPNVGPDVIILTGYEHDCEACKEEILGVIAAIESQVTAEIELDPRYHPRLIGQRGRNLREVQNKYHACKEEILGVIAAIESQVTAEIELDPRYHPRLIGQRGRNLREVQNKYHVEIRLPRKDDPNANPSLVVVAGKNEEDVDACIDFLRNEEEDYMQDIIERYGYMSQRAEPTPAAPPAQVFEIRNAPWQLTDEEQFPAFPGESRQASSGSAHGVWGNRANRV